MHAGQVVASGGSCLTRQLNEKLIVAPWPHGRERLRSKGVFLWLDPHRYLSTYRMASNAFGSVLTDSCTTTCFCARNRFAWPRKDCDRFGIFLPFDSEPISILS